MGDAGRNGTWIQGGSKSPETWERITSGGFPKWGYPKSSITTHIYSQFVNFSIETLGCGDPHFKNASSVYGVETQTIWNTRSALSNPKICATKVGSKLWPQMWLAVVEPLNSSVFFGLDATQTEIPSTSKEEAACSASHLQNASWFPLIGSIW